MAASYSVLASLGWSDTSDYDLYARKNTGSAIYYSNLTSDGLTLNWDAYPGCVEGDGPPPEIISSDVNYTVENTFYFWYNRFSTCGDGGSVTTSVTITNTGDVNIWVNDTLVTPGNNFVGGIELVSSEGDQSGYMGGTEYDVTFSTPTTSTSTSTSTTTTLSGTTTSPPTTPPPTTNTPTTTECCFPPPNSPNTNIPPFPSFTTVTLPPLVINPRLPTTLNPLTIGITTSATTTTTTTTLIPVTSTTQQIKIECVSYCKKLGF